MGRPGRTRRFVGKDCDKNGDKDKYPKGTKGDVHVSEKDVRVTVDLPFMLRVMKGTIESKIHEKLDQIL